MKAARRRKNTEGWQKMAAKRHENSTTDEHRWARIGQEKQTELKGGSEMAPAQSLLASRRAVVEFGEVGAESFARIGKEINHVARGIITEREIRA